MDAIALTFAPVVSGQRGITAKYFETQYSVMFLSQATTDVVAGKDTKVSVTINDLPPNADIDRFALTLYAADGDGTPSADHAGVAINKKKADGTVDADGSGTFSVNVDRPLRPSNVRLLLGDDVVWAFGGVLVEDEYSLPDLKDALNTFLDKQSGTAPLKSLDFVLKSDSGGKVGFGVDLEFKQVKTQSWPNALDSTDHADRNVALTFGSIVRLPLDPLIDQPALKVRLDSVSMDVDGKFDSDRLLGEIDEHDGKWFATVSTDYSVAQGVKLAPSDNALPTSGQTLRSPVRCTGLACYVEIDEKAELYAEIQKDVNGLPDSGAPLAKGTVAIVPSKPDDQPLPWAFVKFAAPVALDTDTPYWIVLKAVQGTLRLGLAPDASSRATAPPLLRQRLCVARSSQTWNDLFRVSSDPSVAAVPAMVSMIGVVYLPGTDDGIAATTVVFGGKPQDSPPVFISIDPALKPQALRLPTSDSDWRQSVLEVRSYGNGTFHVANVIQRFTT